MDEAEFRLKLTADTAGAARQAQRDINNTIAAMKKLEAVSFKSKSPYHPAPPRPSAVVMAERAIQRSQQARTNKVQAYRNLGMHEEADRLAGVKPRGFFNQASAVLKEAGINVPGSALADMGTTAIGVAVAVKGIGLAFDFVRFSVETTLKVFYSFASAILTATAAAFDFGQRSRLAFSSLLGDEAQGRAVFDSVRKEAQDLGLNVEDTVDSYRKLLAAQFSVSQSNELIRATADMRALGASTEDVGHALLAISQIKMKGKLQAEELTRQLANAGVSTELVYKNLQKRLGLGEGPAGRKKILAMQQSGSISSDVAIPAIIDAIKEKSHEANVGEVAGKFANMKISGMLAQARGMLSNFFIDVGSDIEGPVTELAKTIFGSFKNLFESPLMMQLKEKLELIFLNTVATIQENWPKIEPVIVGVMNALVGAFSTVANYIANNGDTITEKISTIAQAAYIFGTVMVGITGVVLKLVDAMVTLAAFVDRHRDVFSTIMKVAGFSMGLVPGLQLPGAALYGAGSLIGSGGGLGIPNGPVEMPAYNQYGNVGLEGALKGLDSSKLGIGGEGGPGGAWKSIGNVSTTVNVSALDLDDPDAAGGKIADLVNRQVNRVLEDSH